jgi:hypothetical protein
VSAQRRAEIEFEAEKLNASMQVHLLRHTIIYLTSVQSTFVMDKYVCCVLFSSDLVRRNESVKTGPGLSSFLWI